MKTSDRILVAVATGIVAGAILGILFAPDKGSEIRKKLNKKRRKPADEVNDTIRKGKEAFNDLKTNMDS